MSLPDDPFISTDDLSAQTGHDIDSTDAHALIAIDAACTICRDTSKRNINRGTATVALDGNGGDCLILQNAPINGISSVMVGGAAITDYCFTTNGRLIRGTAGARSTTSTTSFWPNGRQNVVVTLDCGWDANSIPRSIRMVALAIAERIWAQGPASQESIGDQSVSYEVFMNDLSPGEKMILQRYNDYPSP